MVIDERLDRLEKLLSQALDRIWVLEAELYSGAQPANCPGPGVCSYDSYLAEGEPGEPSLSHGAYHAAAQECGRSHKLLHDHLSTCTKCANWQPCARYESLDKLCEEWENKIRVYRLVLTRNGLTVLGYERTQSVTDATDEQVASGEVELGGDES